MCRRVVCLIFVVLVLGSAGNAADVSWKGGGGNNLWSTPGNWSSNRVPGIGDEVFIDVPPAKAPNGPIIQDGIDAKILGLLTTVAGEPEMTMTGGTLEIGDYIWWGDGPNSHGTFYMSGGTITVANELELGWGGGSGTWIMTGGTVTCGRLRIPASDGVVGELFLHGGTFTNIGTRGLEMLAVGTIDVGDGTLILEGDHTAAIQGFIDTGQITAHGGGGRILLDFDRTNPGKTTLAAVATGVAYSPSPADGDFYTDTWANLGWSPADNAVSHDVYFGDNFEEVDNGTGDTFQGNQGAEFFVVGFPGFPYPDGLIPGTTYYWRIDEVEADGTVHKGDTWSFIIPPKIAYGPSPADGAEFVDPNIGLSWIPGYGAKLHTVYFGDNFDDVSNATGGTSQGVTTYTPGPLDREKVYYWRVDEFDAVTTHKGDVWAFSAPGAVGNPDPANGATGVQMTSTLSWTPGDSATSSELYLGTDKDAVRSATSASPEYKGSKALGSESHDPGKLAWKSTYYWRVDGMSAASAQKGNVWSFETADFITVEDFESYNDLAEEDPESNRIYLKWIDGFGTTTNGSVVGYAELPLTEHGNVHGGRTSMPYSYDNNLKYSEANTTLVYPRDWTEEGVGVLSLWFNGNTSNAAEPMYVILNGSAVVYHDDPAAAQAPEWTRWTIDLQEFAGQGADLTNVDSVGIGFGDKNNIQTGGSGTMLFDDITLYRPAAVPTDPSLLGSWMFDEGSGATAVDSSGNGLDGAVSGAAWASPGSNGAGSCLDFDGQGANLVDLGNFDVTGDSLTIACWYKADNLDTPGNDPRLFSKAIGGSSQDHWFMVSSSRVGTDKVLRFRLKTDGDTGELKADTATGLIDLDIWTHVAAVWDGATMKLYKNGAEVGSLDKGGTLTTNPAANVAIGNQPVGTDSRPWDGLIDDVRLYDRGLSADEVLELVSQ